MPYLDSQAVLPEASVPVELRGKVRNRFYEPIVLLLALTQACMHQHAPIVPEQTPDVADQTPDQLFHDFLNKLALICDTRRGGDTVTAVVALKYPDRVQYRFASNKRSEPELSRVKAFIEDILGSLKDGAEADSPLQHHKLLRKVIHFNRPRLDYYVKSIHAQSLECLKAPEGSITAQTREKLEKLRDLSLEASKKGLEEPTFFICCTNLMQFVKTVSKSEAYRTFRDKANAASGQASPWGTLRHAAGRLLAYLQITRTFFEARKYWDDLFHDFEVVCLPSSTALSNPISRRKISAEDILGRMTSDQSKAAAYRQSAQGLQAFGLDEKIQEEAKNKSFCPLVHGEVLIHDSIVNDPDFQSLHPTKFFNSYKYIGCSKPTCRLCYYYFAACEDNIQIRQTHRNLYHRWRAPNVYKGQGEEAVKRREGILNKMIERIRQDAFRTLDDKIPERKTFDSNTDPTYNLPWYANGWDGALSGDMEHLSVEDTESDDHATPRASQEDLAEAGSGDEDDGGAQLS